MEDINNNIMRDENNSKPEFYDEPKENEIE